MDSLYLLIPIAVIFVAIAVKVLFWAINSGQYDNLDTEAHRILFDDQPAVSASSKAVTDPEQSGQGAADPPPTSVDTTAATNNVSANDARANTADASKPSTSAPSN